MVSNLGKSLDEGCGKMMKFLRLVTILWLLGFVSGCSHNHIENGTKESKINNTVSPTSIEEKVENLTFTWYRESHYEYENTYEQKYSFRIVDKCAMIYGRKCYLLIMYLEGQQYLNFAIDIQLNKLYICEDHFTFIPINNVQILDDSKFIKQAESLIEQVLASKGNNIIYCHTINWNGEIYFMYGEYREVKVQEYFLVNKETKKVFKWNLSKDILEEDN